MEGSDTAERAGSIAATSLVGSMCWCAACADRRRGLRHNIAAGISTPAGPPWDQSGTGPSRARSAAPSFGSCRGHL